MRKFGSFLVFTALVVLAASTGMHFLPGDWYAALNKPVWTPPKEMIARKPEVAKWAGGQPGGLDNPLGARALYIYQNGQDTGYRIHGSPEWWSIGQAMSSGCVRLINQDVLDLYKRVPYHARIVVHQSGLSSV